MLALSAVALPNPVVPPDAPLAVAPSLVILALPASKVAAEVSRAAECAEAGAALVDNRGSGRGGGVDEERSAGACPADLAGVVDDLGTARGRR